MMQKREKLLNLLIITKNKLPENTLRGFINLQKIYPFNNFKILKPIDGSKEAAEIIKESVRVYNFEAAIANAQNLKEIINLINNFGDIKGSGDKVYTPEKIKEYILKATGAENKNELDNIKKDKIILLATSYITRSHGLRDKIEELLKNIK